MTIKGYRTTIKPGLVVTVIGTTKKTTFGFDFDFFGQA
jgi:hypothetical protein